MNAKRKGTALSQWVKVKVRMVRKYSLKGWGKLKGRVKVKFFLLPFCFFLLRPDRDLVHVPGIDVILYNMHSICRKICIFSVGWLCIFWKYAYLRMVWLSVFRKYAYWGMIWICIFWKMYIAELLWLWLCISKIVIRIVTRYTYWGCGKQLESALNWNGSTFFFSI